MARSHLLKDNSLNASDIIMSNQEGERRAFAAKLNAATKFRAFRAANAIGMKGVRRKTVHGLPMQLN